MASIIEWKVWAYAWSSGQSSPFADVVGIEAIINATKRRTCVKIHLDEVNDDRKRRSLTLNLGLSIAQFGPSNLGTRETIGAVLSVNPPSGLEPWGSNEPYTTASINHTSVGSTPSISLTFDISKFSNAAQDFYVYVYGREPDTQIGYQYKVQSGSVSETTDPIYNNVTTGSINGGSTIYVPGQQTNVNWGAGSNGTNNPITGYAVYIRYGAAPTASAYHGRETVSAGSTNYWFTVDGAYRGQAIFTGVQALGAYGNGLVETALHGYVNTVPGKPLFSRNREEVNTSTSITYTIFPGADSIGNSTYYYYSLNGNSWVSCDQTLTIKTSTSGVKAGDNTIKFRVSDGYENSPDSDISHFNAVFKPIISSASCTHTKVKDMNNNSSLTTTSTIKFSLSAGSSSGIDLYVRSRSSDKDNWSDGKWVSLSYYDYSNPTKTATVSILKLPDTLVLPGHYFQFKFAVSDGSTLSDYTDWLTAGRRPKKPKQDRLPEYINNINHSNSEDAKKNYYKDYVTIEQTNKGKADGYAAISSIKIIAYYSNTSKETSKEYSCSIEPGATFSTKLNLSQVNPNTSTSFKFKITDVAGQSVISSKSFLTLTKTSNLVFYGTSEDPAKVEVNISTLKPFSNEVKFKIGHPPASATGSSKVKYTYKLKLDDIEKFIEEEDYEQTFTDNKVEATIDGETINALASSLANNKNKNSEYTITLTAMAADGFAQTVSLETNFKVDFREPPSFPNKNFGIRHDYNIGGSEANGSIGVEVHELTQMDWESQKDALMFNMGEGIIFSMPRAKDDNEDIVEYRIYLARNDFVSHEDILPADKISFDSTTPPWLTLPYQGLTGDKDYFYYRHRASQYTKNEYFYFGFQVKDSTGYLSDIVVCPICIVGCRVANPIISAENIKVERNENIINLSYNLKINDLGGSAKSTGWNKDFYGLYPNFQRSIQIGEIVYEPKATLVVQVSPDPDFKDETEIKTSAPILINSEDWLKEEILCNSIIEGYEPLQTKIFMRFIFTISYGLDLSKNDNIATIESSPWGYSYFGIVPTVAHRANKIGINTKIIGDDEVLVIENFKEQIKIVLKGANEKTSNTIKIDLITGEISGLAMDGGEW